MAELASHQPGYLGMTSLRDADGLGVTISYWSNRESITNWRDHAEHRLAQEQGRATFYEEYRVEVCEIEAARSFTGDPGSEASKT
ncbi:MAG: antibiotic biosynthesis monooxygenase [Planctomycetaceae bacterium]|nr:antibiotic biosynthesis monooxygenase [Planctomycetaceae bacterium]MCA9077280.1 antibiotic biosynthesis monooxygenase [Planctomycetaceae bacterium]